MWDLPGPGLKPVSLVLAGRFLTIVPPGKSLTYYLEVTFLFFVFLFFFLNYFYLFIYGCVGSLFLCEGSL